ncbi:glycosyltransferase [Sphingomonas sp. LR60]|uniref:glycosyltransferase n=1 Tax=Sphingomonas sp. LR60 TaxID=3050233 RepID=UPI002FE2141F
MTRIIFILSYPTYVSVADQAEWLAWNNRDRRMPAILSAMGVEVELWGIGRTPQVVEAAGDDGTRYTVRLFCADNPRRAPREHVSTAMLEAARAATDAFFVVIGTNGGIGYHLFDRLLRPERRRYAVIIGGDYWSRLLPHAKLVFPESAVQEQALAHPRFFWRAPIPRARMLRLPKAIDTELFHPVLCPVQWDVIAISRLSRWKSFDEVGALSQRYRVAVAGGGPDAAALAKRFPKIVWLGHVPHRDVPGLLHRSHVYFHAGRRDYFPRAIVEAMACGKPVIGFGARMGDDVIPADCGLSVDRATFASATAALLDDPARIAAMGAAARRHAVATHGLNSSVAACQVLAGMLR